VENITAQGNVNASTEFPTGEFPARLAVDGSKSTSWFSAGPDAGGGSTFVWGPPDGSKRFIQTVKFFNNALHSRSDFRTGFGFAQVTVAVLDGSKTVFEKTFALPGTPDPNITVQPKVEGDVVRLFFTGHEFPQCGGISELIVTGRAAGAEEPAAPAAADSEKEQAIALVRSILNDKAGQCGGLTVRGISAQQTGNGWRVSADLTTFGNDGTAEWNVIGSRATPAEPLAADIENGCP
jgi:hypothetical protein